MPEKNLLKYSDNLLLTFTCLLSCPSQAAVEVPHYVGVNLLVEGAPIRRSKPPHRLPAIPNPPQAAPFPPDQPPASETADSTWKVSCEQVSRAAAVPSDKENRTVRDVQKTSRVRQSRRGQGCTSHSEPLRKSQRWGLGDKSAPLVPWNLSFTLCPPDRAPPGRCQPRLQPPVSHTSRSSQPQCAALERKSRSTTTRQQALPSLRGPLPTMEVFSLQPNVCGRTSSHP